MIAVRLKKVGRPAGENRIPKELLPTLFDKHASGWSYQRIAQWLTGAKKIEVSWQSIRVAVLRHAKVSGLAAEAKIATREQLANATTDASHDLQQRIVAASKIVALTEHRCISALETGEGHREVMQWHRALDAWSKVRKAYHEAAGLSQPDEPVVRDLKGLLGLALGEEQAVTEAERDSANAN